MWTLSFDRGQGDVGRLQHTEEGFLHALPGAPTLTANTPKEATVRLGELAITLRYQLTRLGPVASQQEMARTLLEHHMLGRQRGTVRVQDVPVAKLKSWGAGGGARAFYSLKEGAVQGVSSELALQLVRGASALNLSCLFHADDLDWIQWAVFEAAIFQRLAWGGDPSQASQTSQAVQAAQPTQSAQPDGPFWPDSPFLEGSLSARLTPDAQHLMDRVSADIMTLSGLENTSDTFRELRRRLRVCIIDQRPPSHPISTRVRDGLRQFLTRQVGNPLLVRHLQEQLDRVQTAHDLRGMAVLFERAIDQLLRWRRGLA